MLCWTTYNGTEDTLPPDNLEVVFTYDGERFAFSSGGYMRWELEQFGPGPTPFRWLPIPTPEALESVAKEMDELKAACAVANIQRDHLAKLFDYDRWLIGPGKVPMSLASFQAELKDRLFSQRTAAVKRLQNTVRERLGQPVAWPDLILFIGHGDFEEALADTQGVSHE